MAAYIFMHIKIMIWKLSRIKNCDIWYVVESRHLLSQCLYCILPLTYWSCRLSSGPPPALSAPSCPIRHSFSSLHPRILWIMQMNYFKGSLTPWCWQVWWSASLSRFCSPSRAEWWAWAGTPWVPPLPSELIWWPQSCYSRPAAACWADSSVSPAAPC